MRKQVLVIGGSYFTGRVFSILTSRGEDVYLHVVNRGKVPLKLNNVSQYVCDRHEPEKMAELLPKDIIFDAVIDFCAYEPTEIGVIIDALSGRIRQYIVFSTASVYTVGAGKKIETDEMIRNFETDDPNAEYVLKKCLLETETKLECEKAGIPYTILRPAFIYGPFNYAPRESWFVQQIVKHNPIPVPVDSDSKFNFVYVMDISAILNLCIANEKAYNQVFNLSAPEDITYASFIETLEKVSDVPFATESMTVKQVNDRSIPLPFPLVGEELYSGKKVENVLGFTYTPFEVGMKKTFDVFKDVYEHIG